MTLMAMLRPSLLLAALVASQLGGPAPALGAPKYTVLHTYDGQGNQGILISPLASDGEGNAYAITQAGTQPTKLVQLAAAASSTTWSSKAIYTYDKPAYFGASAPVVLPTAEGLGLSLFVISNPFDSTPSTIIQVSPSENSWFGEAIYTFPANVSPATLQAGPGGVLYGTTYSSSSIGPSVFSLSFDGAGNPWTYASLYTFSPSNTYLGLQLVISAAGVIYGAANPGGAHDLGYIFSLVNGAAGWSLKELYSFAGQEDGAFPGGLTTDLRGNLYGTTYVGGDLTQCLGQYSGCGTLFELIPPAVSGGKWTLNPLHLFDANAYGQPPAPGLVTLAPGGALFGTTVKDGSAGIGTVFRFSLSNLGVPTYSVLHDFGGTSQRLATDPLLLDPVSGVLYGTDETLGIPTTVFSLTQK
jgi:uncharacterized repeat protein (TIGR03803 family)